MTRRGAPRGRRPAGASRRCAEPPPLAPGLRGRRRGVPGAHEAKLAVSKELGQEDLIREDLAVPLAEALRVEHVPALLPVEARDAHAVGRRRARVDVGQVHHAAHHLVPERRARGTWLVAAGQQLDVLAAVYLLDRYEAGGQLPQPDVPHPEELLDALG